MHMIFVPLLLVVMVVCREDDSSFFRSWFSELWVKEILFSLQHKQIINFRSAKWGCRLHSSGKMIIDLLPKYHHNTQVLEYWSVSRVFKGNETDSKDSASHSQWYLNQPTQPSPTVRYKSVTNRWPLEPRLTHPSRDLHSSFRSDPQIPLKTSNNQWDPVTTMTRSC